MSYFSELIDNSVIRILIIILLIVLAIYLLNFFLRKKAFEYYSQNYWEMRYSYYKDKEMDWYTDFSQVDQKFKITEILRENFGDKRKVNFLEMGCGDSTLAYSLYSLGYKNITSIDFSPTVIHKMMDKYKDTDINWICMDFNELENKFNGSQFDVIIEKAGLDSIATKGTPEVPETLYNIYKKMHYVLKPRGIVLSISSKNPYFWKTTVLERLQNDKIFEMVQIRRSTFSTVTNPTIMNFYFYYLKKI